MSAPTISFARYVKYFLRADATGKPYTYTHARTPLKVGAVQKKKKLGEIDHARRKKNESDKETRTPKYDIRAGPDRCANILEGFFLVRFSGHESMSELVTSKQAMNRRYLGCRGYH